MSVMPQETDEGCLHCPHCGARLVLPDAVEIVLEALVLVLLLLLTLLVLPVVEDT